jgi:CRP-like cAMP-binding protein
MKTDHIKKSECKLTCDFEILRRSPIFLGADNDVIRLFAYLAQRQKFSAGDLIIQGGKEAGKAYYLLSGSAELITLHHNREVVLQQFGPRTFFGELALLARFTWFFSVRSLEESEALVITRESFRKVLENFPKQREILIEKIVQLRVQRLITQTAFMLDKASDSLPAKDGPTI